MEESNTLKSRLGFATLKDKQETLANLKQSYTNLCAQIGDLTFQLEKIKAKLQQLNAQAYQLDREYQATTEATVVDKEPIQTSKENGTRENTQTESQTTADKETDGAQPCPH